MKKRVFDFRADPGHGWLVVNYQDLVTCAVEYLITQYSYMKGDKVYLEEDQDAQTFLNAALSLGWEMTFRETHINRSSPIRKYPTYEVREEK